MGADKGRRHAEGFSERKDFGHEKLPEGVQTDAGIKGVEPDEVFEVGIEKEGIKSGQVAYIPEQTSIFDFIKKETKEETAAGAVPGQRVQNRARDRFPSPGRVLRNTADFATLVAPTRRSAKEIGFIAIVDEQGNILEIEYTKGKKNNSAIATEEIVGLRAQQRYTFLQLL